MRNLHPLAHLHAKPTADEVATRNVHYTKKAGRQGFQRIFLFFFAEKEENRNAHKANGPTSIRGILEVGA